MEPDPWIRELEEALGEHLADVAAALGFDCSKSTEPVRGAPDAAADIGGAGLTIQDLGSIGELIAAAATIATLAYLAIQVRQNTRALRSATFQQISMDMSLSAEAISINPDLAAIVVKASEDLGTLPPEERIRFHFYLVMLFRRLEAVYVQTLLGSIDLRMTQGFERSAISILTTGGAAQWWQATKTAFSAEFAAHVDSQLTSGTHAPIHPGFGRT